MPSTPRLLRLPLTLGFLLLGTNAAPADIVSVGPGSYTTALPGPCEPLPKHLFRAPSLTGPTPTNQWWSSIVWQEHSQNLFPHPLALRCLPQGLAIGYPGTAIVANEHGIIGGGIGETGDVTLGLSNKEAFPEAVLADFSDWFVGVCFTKDEARLDVRFGHGSPFVYARHAGAAPVLRFAEKPVIWSGAEGDSTLGLTVRGHAYGVFGPTGSGWKSDGTATLTLESEKNYFSIALLPTAKPETLRAFAEVAHRHVTVTRVSHQIRGGSVDARYQFTTEAMEGEGDETLFALYPHQWKYTSTPLTGQSYASVRGEMKLARGTGFTTRVPIQGLLPMLPADGITDRERLLGYLAEEPPAPVTGFKDTYWEGKHLGKLATLSGIAESLGETELRDGYITEIKARLENWLTASPGGTEALFSYNRLWGTLIGSPPSYGSDAQLNDHHFHYGYFIRAAAEVARVDPQWADRWGPMVELLIRDIASPDPHDPMFPKLRCFDLYAGHSWASGHADFGDGNNQESSSESLNAWYGIMLWGAATGRRELMETAIFLYNTERTAVEEYWFDVDGTNFPDDFPQVALGMVWGGKGAFATWFSGDIDCIHGINWLPFTPASISLGRHPAYVKKNHDRIVSVRPAGNDYNTGWGDLIVMFNALQNPRMAVAYMDENPACSLEGGNTHAFMYQWIHTLDSLGLNDPWVQADHPFFNVYQKDGKRTYAVYHFGTGPMKVRFSDGHTMTAVPGRLTTSR